MKILKTANYKKLAEGKCPVCNGYGFLENGANCSACKGTGKKEDYEKNNPNKEK